MWSQPSSWKSSQNQSFPYQTFTNHQILMMVWFFWGEFSQGAKNINMENESEKLICTNKFKYFLWTLNIHQGCFFFVYICMYINEKKAYRGWGGGKVQKKGRYANIFCWWHLCSLEEVLLYRVFIFSCLMKCFSLWKKWNL